MENSELDFSLVWPRELFVWEAKRILALPGNISGYAAALLGEAFADAEAPTVPAPTGWSGSFEVPSDKEDRALLSALIGDDSPIRPYRRPQYWLERQSGGTSSVPRKLLSEAFVELIEEMRELDYFPKIMPKGCVDSYGSWGDNPSNSISKAGQVPGSGVTVGPSW